MKHIAMSLTAVLLISPVLAAPVLQTATDGQRDLRLTVYSNDLAVVQDSRALPAGYAQAGSDLVFAGISPAVLAETCVLDGVAVREQQFRDDSSRAALLRQRLGRSVHLQRNHPETGAALREQATVLRTEPELLLRRADGSLSVGLLPGEALLLPADTEPQPPRLQFRVQGKAASRLDLTCQTRGLSWSADYVATLNEAENRLRLSVLATLRNQSGVDYPNARVSLLAGDPQILQQSGPRPMYAEMAVMAAAPRASKMADSAAESAIGDFVLYDLPGKRTLAAGEERQLSLFDTAEVKVRKRYVYHGQLGQPQSGPVSASVRYEFDNSRSAGLGRALPQGIVRFHKADGQGRIQFIGAASLSNTGVDEPVRLSTGTAASVTLDKQVSAQTRNADNRRNSRTVTYTVRNSSERAADLVLEEQGWRQQVVTSAPAAKAIGPWAWRWDITVPAGKTATLSYTVEELRDDE